VAGITVVTIMEAVITEVTIMEAATTTMAEVQTSSSVDSSVPLVPLLRLSYGYYPYSYPILTRTLTLRVSSAYLDYPYVVNDYPYAYDQPTATVARAAYVYDQPVYGGAEPPYTNDQPVYSGREQPYTNDS